MNRLWLIGLSGLLLLSSVVAGCASKRGGCADGSCGVSTSSYAPSAGYGSTVTMPSGASSSSYASPSGSGSIGSSHGYGGSGSR